MVAAHSIVISLRIWFCLSHGSTFFRHHSPGSSIVRGLKTLEYASYQIIVIMCEIAVEKIISNTSSAEEASNLCCKNVFQKGQE